jgi:putative ABC transport system permease protein
MLYNYLKIAVRNLLRHKLFSFINIFGLATGMSVCLLALMQVREVLEYDRFHPHPERTYRILTDARKVNGDSWHLASAPLPLGEVLAREYGFVEKTARVYYDGNLGGELSYGRKALPVEGAFVDPAFYEIFGYPLATGRPAIEPRTVLLTQETAERFFGKENPVGKTLSSKSLGDFTVSGVLAPLPGKSHLQFDLLASMATVPLLNASGQLTVKTRDWEQNWRNYTYVLLREGTPREALDRVLPALALRAVREAGPKMDLTYAFRTQPFGRITPALEDLNGSSWEPTLGSILGVGGLALVILLMAGFNYVNLTLARSLNRAREVGIRKVAGAHRAQLVGQFLAESVLIAFLALGLSYLILDLLELLPSVQRWLTKDIKRDWVLWLFFGGFTLLTGLLAGWVPARVLSGYQPVQVLKGNTGPVLFRRIGLRKGLIVAQFAVSLFFMVFVAAYYRQFSYMASTNYGFDRQYSIHIPLEGINPRVLADEVAALKGVQRVGFTSQPLGFRVDRTRISPGAGGEFVDACYFRVDHNFVRNMNLKVAAGGNMPLTLGDTVSRFVLVNEKAVQSLRLGSPGEAVGKTIWLLDSTEAQIAGVLKDFNYENLSQPIRPLLMQYDPAGFRYLNAKVDEKADGTIMADLERVWKKLSPYKAVQLQWFDEQFYTQHFHLDDQMVLAVLTLMAITIAGLGLLGMVTYTTALRTKEVGIRKVLGASVGSIVALLSRSFLLLLLVAGLIALPLGYTAGSLFLQSFAFHVSLGAGTLLCCLGIMLAVGGLAVGIQTYRAAVANPVNALQSE